MSKVKVGSILVDVKLDALDVETIRAKTPVKTGKLRDGWKLDSEGNVVNEVDYTSEVEFGTVNFPGAFMAHRSISEMQYRLSRRIAEQLNTPGIIHLRRIAVRVGSR